MGQNANDLPKWKIPPKCLLAQNTNDLPNAPHTKIKKMKMKTFGFWAQCKAKYERTAEGFEGNTKQNTKENLSVVLEENTKQNTKGKLKVFEGNAKQNTEET